MSELSIDDLVRQVEQKQPAAPSLTQVSAAVLLSEHLDAVADEVVDHFVRRAREAGASWTDIGQSMGVTKQAAQKRFVSPVPSGETPPARGVEGRYRVLRLAEEEARALGHQYIGTEHLLLGLLRDGGGLACQVLTEAGVVLDEARAEALAIVGRGEGSTAQPTPITPRSRKVLELATREAKVLLSSDPDTEHILLGLIREGKGVGAQILAKLAGDLKDLRHHVLVAAKNR